MNVCARAVAASLFLLAGISPGACAQAATPADPATRVVPDAVLADLGFSPDTATVETEGYAQLLVAAYVTGESASVAFDKCPKLTLWGFNLKNITEGDKTTRLGVEVSAPDLPAVALTPLLLSSKAGGFFGGARDCSLLVDSFKYRSPLYYVRKHRDRDFAVAPTYTVSAELGAPTQANLRALMGVLAAAGGVPAATAAPYLGSIGSALEKTHNTQTQEIIHHFEIRAGKVRPVQEWVVPDALLTPDKNAPPRRVVVVAQLVPVAEIIPAPGGTAAWQPGTVLDTSFRIPSGSVATDGSLRDYLNVYARNEVQAYNDATGVEAANTACNALATKVDAIGMSDRDAALTLWALAKRRAQSGKGSDAEVDGLRCLQDRWPTLLAANVARTPLVEPPKTAGTATVRQMKIATELDNALALFFVTPAWTDRRRLGAQLFRYPSAYTEPAGRVMRGSASIDSVDSWLANAFDRDRPLLAKFGCYVYFDGSKPHPFADLAGRSVMLGFGETAAESDRPATEIVVRLGFAPVADGEDPRIDAVDVQERLAPDVRDAARRAMGDLTQCPSGYQSRLLFGP